MNPFYRLTARDKAGAVALEKADCVRRLYLVILDIMLPDLSGI